MPSVLELTLVDDAAVRHYCERGNKEYLTDRDATVYHTYDDDLAVPAQPEQLAFAMPWFEPEHVAVSLCGFRSDIDNLLRYVRLVGVVFERTREPGEPVSILVTGKAVTTNCSKDPIQFGQFLTLDVPEEAAAAAEDGVVAPFLRAWHAEDWTPIVGRAWSSCLPGQQFTMELFVPQELRSTLLFQNRYLKVFSNAKDFNDDLYYITALDKIYMYTKSSVEELIETIRDACTAPNPAALTRFSRNIDDVIKLFHYVTKEARTTLSSGTKLSDDDAARATEWWKSQAPNGKSFEDNVNTICGTQIVVTDDTKWKTTDVDERMNRTALAYFIMQSLNSTEFGHWASKYNALHALRRTIEKYNAAKDTRFITAHRRLPVGDDSPPPSP